MVGFKESEAEEDDKTCQLSRLFVHPDCRRLGISNRLLQEAKIEALKIGYKRMQVDLISLTVSHIQIHFFSVCLSIESGNI